MCMNSPSLDSLQEAFRLPNDFTKEVQNVIHTEIQRRFAQFQEQQCCNLTDEFIPKEDILIKLKISRGMYANLKKNGIIRDYKLGGKFYIKKSELLATLEKNKS